MKETFEEGSIVLNNGIVKKGFIKIESLAKMNTSVQIKESLAVKETEIVESVGIKSLETENYVVYQQFKIRINKNTDEIIVLANLLLEGKASLYAFNYNGEIFYIVVNNQKDYVLQKDSFKSGDKKVIRNNYIGTLNLATEGFSGANSSLSFDNNSFVKTITAYNKSQNSETKLIININKSKSFLLAYAGVGIPSNTEKEFFAQGIYRVFMPSISDGLSLNTGFNYFNYEYSNPIYDRQNLSFTANIYTIPGQLQYNILNKAVRPYIFGGLSLLYIDAKDVNGDDVIEKGLQSSFGINYNYGAGIEASVYKGIMLKAEYRHEALRHLFLCGIGYNFSK